MRNNTTDASDGSVHKIAVIDEDPTVTVQRDIPLAGVERSEVVGDACAKDHEVDGGDEADEDADEVVGSHSPECPRNIRSGVRGWAQRTVLGAILLVENVTLPVRTGCEMVTQTLAAAIAVSVYYVRRKIIAEHCADEPQFYVQLFAIRIHNKVIAAGSNFEHGRVFITT